MLDNGVTTLNKRNKEMLHSCFSPNERRSVGWEVGKRSFPRIKERTIDEKVKDRVEGSKEEDKVHLLRCNDAILPF